MCTGPSSPEHHSQSALATDPEVSCSQLWQGCKLLENGEVLISSLYLDLGAEFVWGPWELSLFLGQRNWSWVAVVSSLMRTTQGYHTYMLRYLCEAGCWEGLTATSAACGGLSGSLCNVYGLCRETPKRQLGL